MNEGRRNYPNACLGKQYVNSAKAEILRCRGILYVYHITGKFGEFAESCKFTLTKHCTIALQYMPMQLVSVVAKFKTRQHVHAEG